MFCPNCGSEVAGGARFCPNCGQSLVQAAELTDEVPTPTPPQAPVPSQAGRPQSDPFAGGASQNRTKVILIVVAAVAVVIALIAVGTCAANSGVKTEPAPVAISSTATSPSSFASSAASTSSSAASSASASGSSSAVSPFSSSSDQAFDTWADECVDKWGTPTGYAVSELRGWQLETLLQQLGFTWSDSSESWQDANTSVTVLDDDLEPLDDDGIAELGKGGAGEAVVYQVSTRNYPAAQGAYQGLVSDVMVSEDSEFIDDLGFGVAYGPSMSEFLVYVYENGDSVEMLLMNRDAIAAGVLDRVTGGSYGATPSAAFEGLVGRSPGSQR